MKKQTQRRIVTTHQVVHKVAIRALDVATIAHGQIDRAAAVDGVIIHGVRALVRVDVAVDDKVHAVGQEEALIDTHEKLRGKSQSAGAAGPGKARTSCSL